MGIYESKQQLFNRDRTVLTITRDPGYGEIIVESWVKVCEIRDRQNCFCCSCGDREGTDVACRNHGWAAKRPCEMHEMPGTPWGEEMCSNDCEGVTETLLMDGEVVSQINTHKENCLFGKMPDSVQKANQGEDS